MIDIVAEFRDKFIFFIRVQFKFLFGFWVRRIFYVLLGADIGNTCIPKATSMTWPHKVTIGNNCTLESGIYFKCDGPWTEGKSIVIGNQVFIGKDCEFNVRKKILIGADSLIAAGCKFIDHDHGMSLATPMNQQPSVDVSIVIGKDVWLGYNVIVLKGVVIGDGAIVGAGSIVTKSIPAKEIWAGVPARFFKSREL